MRDKNYLEKLKLEPKEQKQKTGPRERNNNKLSLILSIQKARSCRVRMARIFESVDTTNVDLGSFLQKMQNLEWGLEAKVKH